MVRVLFVNLPPQGLLMPSLGIASLCANIRDVAEVGVFDFNIELYHEDFFQKIRWEYSEVKSWESEATARCLLNSKAYSRLRVMFGDGDYDIVCFSINLHGYRTLDFVLGHLFEQVGRKLVLVGGPFCSEAELVNLCKSKYVDLFVIGEGELVLREVVKLYEEKGSIEGLKNVRVTDLGNRFVAAGKIMDLDVLENPDYSLFDLSLYKDKHYLPLYFSRGCDYNCNFCRDKPLWGSNVWRNPESIVEEMVYLNKKYGVNHFNCIDLDVLGDLDKMRDLCHLIVEKGLNFSWSGQGRVDDSVTLELLKVMRQGGCDLLTLGLESGSSRVCRDMGKVSPKVVGRFMRMAYDAKIKVWLNVIVGYPTETWWDFFKTVFFLLNNSKYIDKICSINALYLLPESILFSKLGKYNIRIVNEQRDWAVKGRSTVIVRKMRCRILELLFKSKRYI